MAPRNVGPSAYRALTESYRQALGILGTPGEETGARKYADSGRYAPMRIIAVWSHRGLKIPVSGVQFSPLSTIPFSPLAAQTLPADGRQCAQIVPTLSTPGRTPAYLSTMTPSLSHPAPSTGVCPEHKVLLGSSDGPGISSEQAADRAPFAESSSL